MFVAQVWEDLPDVGASSRCGIKFALVYNWLYITTDIYTSLFFQELKAEERQFDMSLKIN